MTAVNTKADILLEFSITHYHHDSFCPTCEKSQTYCDLPECPLCFSQGSPHFTTRDAARVVSEDYRDYTLKKS